MKKDFRQTGNQCTRLSKIAIIALALFTPIALSNTAEAKHRHHHKHHHKSGYSAAGIIKSTAARYGIPIDLARRVAWHETGARCGVWGDHGRSGGPYQIFYFTARRMGWTQSFHQFRASSCERLADMGAHHLALALRAAHGNQWLAALKHNGGLGAGKRNRMARRYANAVMGGQRIRIIPAGDVP